MINPGLRKAVIVLPVAWTGAWLTYYGGSNLWVLGADTQLILIRSGDHIFVNGTRAFKRH